MAIPLATCTIPLRVPSRFSCQLRIESSSLGRHILRQISGFCEGRYGHELWRLGTKQTTIVSPPPGDTSCAPSAPRLAPAPGKDHLRAPGELDEYVARDGKSRCEHRQSDR